jgi:hypothetical protein
MARIDQSELREALKGKSKEQQQVIKYFVDAGGCLSFIGIGKPISDAEYERMLFSRRDSMDYRARALAKINLDLDELKEVPPAHFEGYKFQDCYAKKTAKGNWVSSAYEVAWLFFGSEQVYLYTYTFHMDEDFKSERTREFFYKDVTSFTTDAETETAHGLGDKRFQVQTNKFAMIVPGDKLFVSMEGVKDPDAVIQGMKQKLREKKKQ